MRKFFLLALTVVSVLLAQAAVYTPATVPDPKVNGQEYYVSNPDSILADSTVNWLNDCALRLDNETHVEMAIVALESIDDADAFDFAYELFQRWGIGRAGQNTGVLILFVLDSHDLRIMTGTGIEGVLTDARCSKIMHEEMFPAFRAGDYDGGLCLGALAIYEVCTDGEAPEELLTIQSVTNRGKYADDGDNNQFTTGEIITLCVAGLIVLFFIFVCYCAFVKKCPNCKKRRAKAIKNHVITAATYSHAGEEEVTYRCKNCGHVFIRKEIIPKLTSSSSSGGGGRHSSGGGHSSGSWGGGSTSGGGAGGKW